METKIDKAMVEAMKEKKEKALKESITVNK